MDNLIVSVIIACYNEKEFITGCLDSLLNQKFSEGEFEIIVVDGISNDGTRDLLVGYRNCERIKIFDNINRSAPFAFNIGIREAKGKYITIASAHAVYSENFLQNSINVLRQHPEISCAGGPIIHYGKNNFGKGAALAMSHPVGIGNAKHRFYGYEGYAEGAGFPTFKREVFDKIGLYDERFMRNQDDELNYRLVRSGGKVYLSPEIKSKYLVRDSPGKLFKQYFDYGFWRVAVIKKHKLPVSFRQIIPFIFFGGMFILLVTSFFVSQSLKIAFYSVPLVYIIIVAVAGALLPGIKSLTGRLNFMLAVVILHTSYALGFAKGLFKFYKF